MADDTGTAVVALGGLTVAATGTVAVSGTAVVTLGGLTVAATAGPTTRTATAVFRLGYDDGES